MRCAPPFNCPPIKAWSGGELAALVRSYRLHNRPRAVQELKFFKNMPSLGLAIHHAGLAIDSREKRFSHQCRIPLAALRAATSALQHAAGRLKTCASFHELHELLLELLGGLRGLGELYVYDTALRLGATLGHAP